MSAISVVNFTLIQVGFQEKTAPSKSNKLLIIMDEIDGMSAGDRGGIVELTSLIKKTQVR